MLTKRPAQNILELMIAAGIIIVSVFAATTLIISTMTAGRVSQSRIEAANIARGAAEIVRGIRDSNWLKRAANLVDGNSPVDVTAQWDDTGRLDDGYRPLGAASAVIYRTTYNPSQNRWEMESGTPISNCDVAGVSDYFRVFQAKTASGDFLTQGCSAADPITSCTATRYCAQVAIQRADEPVFTGYSPSPEASRLKATITVTWTDRTGNRELVAEEHLYDWQ